MILILASLVAGGTLLGTGSAIARDEGRNASAKSDKDDKNDNREDDRERPGQSRNKDDDKEFPGRDKADEADDDDYENILDVEPDREDRKGPNASNGSFIAKCGTNGNGHRNSDNYMVAPDKRNGAQHVHDYVGNLSTDAFSDEESLHKAGTTCDRNNKSTFFWPVLRDTRFDGDDENRDGGGLDGNFGRILRPTVAEMRFVGNPRQKVKTMPDDLMIITGDAKAKTNGDKNANAQWTCTGYENRLTDKYPLCPSGSKLVRILEFPNCWDGENLDSKDMRQHTAFADDDGDCKDDFEPIPQLRMRLVYDQPPGRNFSLDTFPDQQHDPRTDHADFENMAPDAVRKLMSDCINDGRNC
ncbi:hypothetical protein GCM10023321_00470 [Pseudonocardia eucalypti]|uniref:DUF1996 domain-containing protein n=2 Tax=Pseudonocardia eucalypti TaxID=648755 RepID=A0ABP9PCF8_9PSEU